MKFLRWFTSNRMSFLDLTVCNAFVIFLAQGRYMEASWTISGGLLISYYCTKIVNKAEAIQKIVQEQALERDKLWQQYARE